MSTVSVLESDRSDQLAASTCSIVECVVVYCKWNSVYFSPSDSSNVLCYQLPPTKCLSQSSSSHSHRSSSYLLSAKHAYGNIHTQYSDREPDPIWTPTIFTWEVQVLHERCQLCWLQGAILNHSRCQICSRVPKCCGLTCGKLEHAKSVIILQNIHHTQISYSLELLKYALIHNISSKPYNGYPVSSLPHTLDSPYLILKTSQTQLFSLFCLMLSITQIVLHSRKLSL